MANSEAASKIETLIPHLEVHGYAVMRQCHAGVLVDVLEAIGTVIHVEEVVVRATGNALVTSARGLSFHTDHHRADRIAWYCIAQCDVGGESVLVDAVEAYCALDERHRHALERVSLKEHSVFRGDESSFPMVTFRDGSPRIYYSYWLADESMDGIEREALEAFRVVVDRMKRIELRLLPGDVLAIDNGRMLHGRRPIEGNAERHLRRFWLRS